MRKILLAPIMCFILALPALAQSNLEGMRFLTITALMQYGQKLYDRGDYDEASAVFNHILDYDHKQPQALHYLKDMGYAPMIGAKPYIIVDVNDTQSLKRAIAVQQRSIGKLQTEIDQMKSNLGNDS